LHEVWFIDDHWSVVSHQLLLDHRLAS